MVNGKPADILRRCPLQNPRWRGGSGQPFEPAPTTTLGDSPCFVSPLPRWVPLVCSPGNDAMERPPEVRFHGRIFPIAPVSALLPFVIREQACQRRGREQALLLPQSSCANGQHPWRHSFSELKSRQNQGTNSWHQAALLEIGRNCERARCTPLLQPQREGLDDFNTWRGLKITKKISPASPGCCYQQFGIYTSALHHYPSRSQLFKALMQTTCRTRGAAVGPGGMGTLSEGKTNKQISPPQSPTQHIFHALWAPPEAASCLKKNTWPKLSICLTWWKSECYFLLYCPYSTSTRIYFFFCCSQLISQ